MESCHSVQWKKRVHRLFNEMWRKTARKPWDCIFRAITCFCVGENSLSHFKDFCSLSFSFHENTNFLIFMPLVEKSLFSSSFFFLRSIFFAIIIFTTVSLRVIFHFPLFLYMLIFPFFVCLSALCVGSTLTIDYRTIDEVNKPRAILVHSIL